MSEQANINFGELAEVYLVDATPEVDTETGVVESWEIEVQLHYGEMRKTYNDEFKVLHLNKTTSEFSKSELLSLANVAQFRRVFDSQYKSTMFPPKKEKVKDFKIKDLKD